MSPDGGMSTDVIAAGVIGIVGAVAGLFAERWVRTLGTVTCEIDWRNTRGAGSVDSPGGVQVYERQLKATFLNRKDVPVTVWDMRVVFYKGGKPLDEEERPHMEFTDPREGSRPLNLVSLPPHIPVTRTISVTPGRNEPDKPPAVWEADRVEFVAIIEGAKDIRRELALWGELTPQTEGAEHVPWWRRIVGGG